MGWVVRERNTTLTIICNDPCCYCQIRILYCRFMEDTRKKKTKFESHRYDTLNMRIDPKLKYLAEIAARDQLRTLSSFVELAIRRALTPEVMREEPGYGTQFKTEKPTILWGEGFWDIDYADRLFLLATGRQDLLHHFRTTAFWKVFTLNTQEKGKKNQP